MKIFQPLLLSTLGAVCILFAACSQEKGSDMTTPINPDTVQVNVVTTLGSFIIEVNRKQAPITAENFLRYVKEGFYDETIFHRVIPRFVIQGGGFDTQMSQKGTHPPIGNESQNGLKNIRGSLSMARTNDPDSATSQFFINLRNNKSLDPENGRAGYAVFGQVIEGIETVDSISSQRTGRRQGHSDVPVENVVVKSMSVLEK